MTTLTQDVQALLDPLSTGGAWYGAYTKGDIPSEFIVWTRTSSSPNVTLGGPTDLQNTRIQIDIFAQSASRAQSIEAAVEAAFSAWAVPNVPLLSQDIYEEPVRMFRVIKEYSIWATN